jgi:dTDP-4-dehydrorhamnose reductase
MKVLVLGANGMLGSSLMRVLSETDDMDVFGTVRSEEARKFFSLNIADKLVRCDVENKVCLFKVFEKIRRLPSELRG